MAGGSADTLKGDPSASHQYISKNFCAAQVLIACIRHEVSTEKRQNARPRWHMRSAQPRSSGTTLAVGTGTAQYRAHASINRRRFSSASPRR